MNGPVAGIYPGETESFVTYISLQWELKEDFSFTHLKRGTENLKGGMPKEN
jgi:hypothetical protein